MVPHITMAIKELDIYRISEACLVASCPTARVFSCYTGGQAPSMAAGSCGGTGIHLPGATVQVKAWPNPTCPPFAFFEDVNTQQDLLDNAMAL